MMKRYHKTCSSNPPRLQYRTADGSILAVAPVLAGFSVFACRPDGKPLCELPEPKWSAFQRPPLEETSELAEKFRCFLDCHYPAPSLGAETPENTAAAFRLLERAFERIKEVAAIAGPETSPLWRNALRTTRLVPDAVDAMHFMWMPYPSKSPLVAFKHCDSRSYLFADPETLEITPSDKVTTFFPLQASDWDTPEPSEASLTAAPAATPRRQRHVPAFDESHLGGVLDAGGMVHSDADPGL